MKLSKKDYNSYKLYIFLVVCILLKTAVHAQDKSIPTWEIPEEIQVTSIEETIQHFDSIINQAKSDTEKASALQQKGQVLVQVHRIKEAQKVYELALKTVGETASETEIKILTGLGEIADLEENSTQASSYFSEAYAKAKELKSIDGLLWILFHKGSSYVTPEIFSISELKAMERYASRYLYSKPQLALATSNWMIQYCGEHIEYAEDGYIFSGLVYRDWGQFDKALTQFYKAIELRGDHVFRGDSKYSSLLNIAAVHDMQGEEEKSMQIIKKVIVDAKQDGDDWGLGYGLKDLAISLMLYGQDEEAIPYFEECIPVMQRLKDTRGEGVCYGNLAQVYLNLNEYKKCQENIAKALKLLKVSNYDQLYASSLLTKAAMYKKLGKWEEAKTIMNEGLVMLKRINALEQLMYAYKLFISYYTHSNNAVMVQKYTDSILEVNQKLYEKSRLFESENLKVRYETEKKEVQLGIQRKLNTALKEEASLHKKLRNTLFFILLLSVIVLLLFFNKYRLQNKLVVEREKRNALEKKQLEETMNHKQRELTSMTLQMLQKNEMLQELKQSVNILGRKDNKDAEEEVKKLKSMLQSQHRLDQDWSTFKIHFDGVHPNFFEKLSKIANLTQQDLRHCSYIKMGLVTKEIAQLMNISASSVQMARYRLKKKLALNRETDIYTFIQDLQ
ncbi:LuxR C-terminal-related transcriptional regulator [uncultured Kordia sp.]|uniref:LuxR C-terminal-related transcriptional regulator n=1 Tax=uncultured Kordia sp. TaxID=507699 RepID=UPI0026137070|nr:LuxR C-terminal-related transcriptional regulator [uncultured Kordia sp.]